jgi:hypothetical protein
LRITATPRELGDDAQHLDRCGDHIVGRVLEPDLQGGDIAGVQRCGQRARPKPARSSRRGGVIR